MTEFKRKVTDIKAILEAMDEFEIAEAWNNYCENVNYCDDMVYSMGELGDICYGWDAMKVIETFCDGDFNTNDGWFRFTIYGAESGSVWDFVDLDDLAEYAVDHEEDFGNSDIRDILLGESEETEESDE